MSNAVVVRYQTTVDGTEENQNLVEQVYAELSSAQPAGLRYLTLRLADGVTFVHVALIEGENPLLHSEAFATFQAGLPDRLVAPPHPSEATVVGSYGF